MVRITSAVYRLKKRKRLLKRAKGFWGYRKNHSGIAIDAVLKAMRNSYIHRKLKKRDFRSLWIARLRVAAKIHGMAYHNLINGLKRANIELNRKVLSELAIKDPISFKEVALQAKAALAAN